MRWPTARSLGPSRFHRPAFECPIPAYPVPLIPFPLNSFSLTRSHLPASLTANTRSGTSRRVVYSCIVHARSPKPHVLQCRNVERSTFDFQLYAGFPRPPRAGVCRGSHCGDSIVKMRSTTLYTMPGGTMPGRPQPQVARRRAQPKASTTSTSNRRPASGSFPGPYDR